MSVVFTEIGQLPAHEWDVIVIGAGVAGCISARQYAQWGWKTLLVEGRAVPRPKVCGGCLNSRAIRILDQIGLTQIVHGLRGEPFYGISLASGPSTAFLTLPAGFSVTRQTLDLALIDAARAAGAVVLTETSAAVQPEINGATRRVELRCHARVSSVHAKVVVCADGLLRTSLHALPLMKTTQVANSRIGVGAVFEAGTVCDSLADRVPRHRITMIAERHGYVGITWAEAGRLSVAAALDPHFMKSARSPGAAINQLLARHGIEFPEDSGWQGTPSLSVSPRRNSAERIFVIGDAAGYVEPFTGEGMAAAAEEAVSVAPLVREAVQGWHPALAESWQRQHRCQFRKRQRICQLASILLRRPWLSRLAVTSMNLFPQPVNYLVNCIARPTPVLPQG